MTFSEYKRLLAAARRKNDKRMELVLCLVAAIGIKTGELRYVTAEAAQSGVLRIPKSTTKPAKALAIPGSLQLRLLEYCESRGIRKGSILITKTGSLVDRSNLSMRLKELCDEAGVSRSKGSIRALQQVYRQTQSNMECAIRQFVGRYMEIVC